MGLLDLLGGGGGGNAAYVVARVRVRKTRLLPADTYPKLLARDVHEIARTLQEGEYQAEVDQYASRFGGGTLIERAVQENLSRTFTEVLGWCQGDLREMVALFLGRYDSFNIKTILRGKFAGIPPQEIVDNLVPAARLSEAQLEDLAALPGIPEVVEALRQHPAGPALRQALDDQGSTVGSLMPLETALDQAYYAKLLDAVPPDTGPKAAFRTFLREEIDILNLKTVLRLHLEDQADLEPHFVPGGAELTLDRARTILRSSLAEAPRLVGELSFGDELEEDLEAFAQTRNLSDVTMALDKLLLASAQSFSYRHPLSVLPIIDFILRKRTEVNNLVAIAHGREHGLSDEVIEEMLVR